MGLISDHNYGQTPLDEEEARDLLIPTVTTKDELNQFEQQNIEEAMQWLLGKSPDPATIFTESFTRNIHKRMFEQIWKWAGEFRRTEKNLGIPFYKIPSELHLLLDDAKHWFENQTYSPDEQAIRFKHRIASIHCFSNGNGRHSRLMADIIATKVHHLPEFSWGASDLSASREVRLQYLKAVKIADKGNYKPLLAFARS